MNIKSLIVELTLKPQQFKAEMQSFLRLFANYVSQRAERKSLYVL